MNEEPLSIETVLDAPIAPEVRQRAEADSGRVKSLRTLGRCVESEVSQARDELRSTLREIAADIELSAVGRERREEAAHATFAAALDVTFGAAEDRAREHVKGAEVEVLGPLHGLLTPTPTSDTDRLLSALDRVALTAAVSGLDPKGLLESGLKLAQNDATKAETIAGLLDFRDPLFARQLRAAIEGHAAPRRQAKATEFLASHPRSAEGIAELRAVRRMAERVTGIKGFVMRDPVDVTVLPLNYYD